MATLAVNVIPNAFNSQTIKVGQQTKDAEKNSVNTIRRPTRGIELNEDTFATLRVVTGTGKNIPIVDAGSRAMAGKAPLEVNGKRANDIYSNFLLQSVQEERQEKAQILETFGEAYIFLFGERARVLNFTGVLINTEDFNWEAEWWHNYDNYLRGTRCIENNSRVFLSYDNTLVSGYILNSAASKNAQERNWVNFAFQLFVTSYASLTTVGDPRAGDQIPFEQTSEALQLLRPRLIGDVDEALAAMAANGGKLPKLLSGGFLGSSSALAQKALNTISTVSTTIQKYGNLATRMANNLINGDVVKIPAGFAGTTVYDTNIERQIFVNELVGGTIKYTTFSDNDDEYVGKSSHYGSAGVGLITRSEAVLFEDIDIEGVFQDGVSQANQARKTWQQAGFTVAAQSFMGDLTAKINPIKKLGLAIYTGINTTSKFVSVLTKGNGPAFHKTSPIPSPGRSTTKQGAGTIAHKTIPRSE